MKNILIAILIAITIVLLSCKQIDNKNQVSEGKFENNTYSNEEIGWIIKIPKNWKIISKKQNKDFQKKGLSAMEEMADNKIDVNKLKNLIGFQKDQFNLFQSTIEPFKVEYKGEWEENNAAVKILIYSTYANQGIKVDSSKTTNIKIDELDFLTYGFVIYRPKGKIVLNQIVYSKLLNGFDFSVNINYNQKKYKEDMLSSWRRSQFKSL